MEHIIEYANEAAYCSCRWSCAGAPSAVAVAVREHQDSANEPLECSRCPGRVSCSVCRTIGTGHAGLVP